MIKRLTLKHHEALPGTPDIYDCFDVARKEHQGLTFEECPQGVRLIRGEHSTLVPWSSIKSVAYVPRVVAVAPVKTEAPAKKAPAPAPPSAA